MRNSFINLLQNLNNLLNSEKTGHSYGKVINKYDMKRIKCILF